MSQSRIINAIFLIYCLSCISGHKYFYRKKTIDDINASGKKYEISGRLIAFIVLVPTLLAEIVC